MNCDRLSKIGFWAKPSFIFLQATLRRHNCCQNMQHLFRRGILGGNICYDNNLQREQFESVDYINIVRIWNNVWSRPSRWYSIRFFYFTRNDLVTAPLKTWVLLQTYRLTLNQCTNIRPPPPSPQVYIVGKYRFIVTFVIIYKNNVSRFSASFHEFDQNF